MSSRSEGPRTRRWSRSRASASRMARNAPAGPPATLASCSARSRWSTRTGPRACTRAPGAAALSPGRRPARPDLGHRSRAVRPPCGALRGGRADEAAEQIPGAVVRRFSFAGTPAEVAAQAREVLDAGARRVEFGPPHGLDARVGVRLLAGRVGTAASGELPGRDPYTAQVLETEARASVEQVALLPFGTCFRPLTDEHPEFDRPAQPRSGVRTSCSTSSSARASPRSCWQERRWGTREDASRASPSPPSARCSSGGAVRTDEPPARGLQGAVRIDRARPARRARRRAPRAALEHRPGASAPRRQAARQSRAERAGAPGRGCGPRVAARGRAAAGRGAGRPHRRAIARRGRRG